MKTRLLHVRANVKELSRALEWYKDVLGFSVGDSWPREIQIYTFWAWRRSNVCNNGTLDLDGNEIGFVDKMKSIRQVKKSWRKFIEAVKYQLNGITYKVNELYYIYIKEEKMEELIEEYS